MAQTKGTSGSSRAVRSTGNTAKRAAHNIPMNNATLNATMSNASKTLNHAKDYEKSRKAYVTNAANKYAKTSPSTVAGKKLKNAYAQKANSYKSK